MLTLDEISEALIDLGLEVESISQPSDRLSQFKVGEDFIMRKTSGC